MNRIRQYRMSRGWSLQQLAEAVGTGKSQIDKLEKGERRLTVDWMVRLSKPLRCDPRDLMVTGFKAMELGAVEKAPRGKKEAMLPVRDSSGKTIDHTARPDYLKHVQGAYAVYVFDDVMAPMYRPRQVLLINPYKIPLGGSGVVIVGKKGALLVREFVEQTVSGIVVREYGAKMREVTIPQSAIGGIHAVAGTVEP